MAYALALKNVPFQVGNRQTAANAKNYLAERASWQRQRGGPPVIWNGENGVDVSLSLSDLPLANFSTSQ